MAPIKNSSSLRFLVFLPWAVLIGSGPVLAQTLALGPDAFKKMSLEELMDMDVTSVARQAEPLWASPSAIQVITSEQVRRSGASSIPQALRWADNLHVAQKSSYGWAISSRGFNSDFGNKLLVLIDGRSVYTPLFSGVFWDVQDQFLEDLDRIEVISGPGGTMWGANAVNGVINVTSKRAKETQGGIFQGGVGSEQRAFGGVRLGGTLASDLYFRVYGKGFLRDRTVGPNGDDSSDAWSMGRGGFRVDAEPSSEELLTLQGDVYSGDEDLDDGDKARIKGGNILGRWSRSFSTGSEMSLQAYYDRTHLRLPKPANAFAPAGTLVDDLDTCDLDFHHRFHWDEAHHFVWGLGYRFTHDVVQNAPSVAFLPPTLDHHLFSGFLQDEIALGPDLFFTLGSKIEHNDYTGFEFEPSTRLKWEWSDDQVLWAAVSRAVRTPSRVDRDERVPTPGLIGLGIENLLVGSSGFRSETLIAYELGYRAQLSRDLFTSVAFFYNLYDNLRSVTPQGPPDLLAFANDLEAETYGIEAGLDLQVVEGWRLHAGYGLVLENLWVDPGETDFSNTLNETADPENRVSVRSSMDLPGGMELDAALRWVDAFIYNDNGAPGRVPGYVELDLRLGWRPLEELELSLVGQNLLNDQHPEYVISGGEQPKEIQRGFHGKVTCLF